MTQVETQVASLAAAVSQLDLALRESQCPVDELGAALARLSGRLESVRATAATDATDATTQSLANDCRDVLRDVSICIESMQFYDRMTQHLSHLRDFIVGIIAVMQDSAAAEQESTNWERLRVNLRRKLISEAQRELLDLILPPPRDQAAAARGAQRLHVGEGSIELF